MAVLTAETRQMLLDSRRRALLVLSESEQRAESLVEDAKDASFTVLLKQQEKAARLLASQVDDDEQLTESHRLAAEILVADEKARTTRLGETVQDEAIDILVAGQREAAAILLDAQMKVADIRSKARRSAT